MGAPTIIRARANLNLVTNHAYSIDLGYDLDVAATMPARLFYLLKIFLFYVRSFV